MAFANAIEATPLSIWVRESGTIWAYPMIIFLHSVGLAIMVGLNVAIDLRLLGFAPKLPIAPLEKLYPIMWFGFWINAVTGVLLLIGDAGTMLIAPLFYFKIAVIAASVTILIRIRRRVFHDPATAQNLIGRPGKTLAAVSLALWVVAITAGRLTAYIGPAVALKGINH